MTMPAHNSFTTRTSKSRPALGFRRPRYLDSEMTTLRDDLYRRIASELHDTTCQHLIAISLGVMQLKNTTRDGQTIVRICEQIDASVDQALKELRSLTYLLHPQHPFDEGLKATIERYAHGFAARTSLIVDVAISPAVDSLSNESQQSLIRIIQEALTNVYRHARATRVGIALVAKGINFNLEVSDNGQGMLIRESRCRFRQPALGTGLRIMRTRLREMGGTLEVISASTARRRGTTLRATFPIDNVTRARKLGGTPDRAVL
jgi:two-component system, NarL family, sensor kinase